MLTVCSRCLFLPQVGKCRVVGGIAIAIRIGCNMRGVVATIIWPLSHGTDHQSDQNKESKLENKKKCFNDISVINELVYKL